MAVVLCEPLCSLSLRHILILLRAFAALESPKLFSSLILVDPVILKPYDREEQAPADVRVTDLIYGSLNRRSVWPSKYVALLGDFSQLY